MTTSALSTVRDLLRYAVSRFNKAGLFFGHGNSDAMNEAAYLILHTLHLPLDRLDPFLDAKLLPNEVDAVLAIIKRRCEERLPAAYLTHEAWLGEFRFYVDERVLVPRSFLAELIPLQCTPWIAEPDAVTDILELCTGSGCLAIMLADAFPDAQVDAVDISSDALKVAQRNLDDYRLNDRIKLIEGDLYSAVGGTQYDMIIANPPYVCADSMLQLPIEYQQEPRVALDGGKDGMDLVRQIVAGAARYLKPDGILIVEIGNERMHAELAFPNLDMTWVTTSAGDDMVFTVTAKQLRSANTDATHLAKQA